MIISLKNLPYFDIPVPFTFSSVVITLKPLTFRLPTESSGPFRLKISFSLRLLVVLIGIS